jgi:hypothetical protein
MSTITMTITTSDSKLQAMILQAIASGKASMATAAATAAIGTVSKPAVVKAPFDKSTAIAYSVPEKAGRMLADCRGSGMTSKVMATFGLDWPKAKALVASYMAAEDKGQLMLSPNCHDAIKAALDK